MPSNSPPTPQSPSSSPAPAPEPLSLRGLAWLVLATAAAAIGWLGFTTDPAALAQLAFASFALFGKFIVFYGLDADAALDPVRLALLAWTIDVAVAFVLSFGLERLERLPVIGRWLRRGRARALQVLTEYPRLERMAFWGVALLVLLPIAGTGAVTGSFAARLVGLGRSAGIVSISLGAGTIAFVFVLLAEGLGAQAETWLRSPVLAAASLVGLIAFLAIAYRRVKRLLRRPLA